MASTAPMPKWLCVGICSGAYESLKVLSRVEKGVDTATLAFVLEFWHGHWFNKTLLAHSLQLSSEDELLELERGLQEKLTQVRDELRERQRVNKAPKQLRD
ncbi:hypothetical protein ON010_g2226 [Phytophthora cinnamomi]|nr:hypothetical protein ON010_g2226 [Phytophthora cinnamomi]